MGEQEWAIELPMDLERKRFKSDQKLMTYKAKTYMSDIHNGEESGEFFIF